MQRRQQEQHRIRVHRDDEQRENGQREQGADLAGELLGVGDGSPRQQPVAPDEPADGEEGSVDGQADSRPLRPGRQLRREWPARTRLPDPEEREELEEHRCVEPERKPAAIAAEGRGERDVSPPKPGEEVDDHRQARQRGRNEDEDDGPAADNALAEVDIGRCALGELDLVVKGLEQGLARAPERCELSFGEVFRRVCEGRRRPVSGRRDGDSSDPAIDERRLFVEAQREAEIEELSQCTWSLRLHSRLLGNALGSCSDELRGCKTGRVAVEHEARRASSADRVQVDGCDHPVAELVLRGEVLCSQTAEGPAVGGQEEDRVVRRERLRRDARRGKRACELDQGGRSRAIVVRARARAGIVPVRNDHDGLVRASLADRADVFELDLAPTGDFRVKTVNFGVQPEFAQLVGDPVRGVVRGRRAGCSNREVVREPLGGQRRRCAVELGL